MRKIITNFSKPLSTGNTVTDQEKYSYYIITPDTLQYDRGFTHFSLIFGTFHLLETFFGNLDWKNESPYTCRRLWYEASPAYPFKTEATGGVLQ